MDETRNKLKCLYDELSRCERCELCKLEINKRKLLPRIGRKKYLIVSQNPSYFHSPEDEYVWGALNNLPLPRLEKFLIERNLLINDFNISNLIKCSFLENKVPPNVDEIVAKCSHWIVREISIINPRCILILGTLAGKYFGLSPGENGTWNFIKTYCAYHPNFVVRTLSYEQFFKMFEEALKCS